MAGFPMSPAQAAILGQRAPVAVVPAAPMINGMPISPAQAAALGVGAQSNPIAAAQAQQVQPLATGGAGQYGVNPLADVLLARATRPGDIRNGVGLLGRLAALGVGQHLQQGNLQKMQEAALGMAETLPPEMQSMAKFAVLSGAGPKDLMNMMLSMRGQEIQTRGQDLTVQESQANRAANMENSAADRASRNEIATLSLLGTAAQGAANRETQLAIAQGSQAIAAEGNRIKQMEAEIKRGAGDNKGANELMDDYRAESSNFKVQAQSMRAIQAAAADPSPAGDMALIFSYMKVLDPTSTVREGEQASVRNAGNVPERVRAQWNALITGAGSLDPRQRADILNRAGRLFVRARDNQIQTEEEFIGIAQRRGVDPSKFMVDYMGDLRNMDPASYAPPQADTGAMPPPPEGFTIVSPAQRGASGNF